MSGGELKNAVTEPVVVGGGGGGGEKGCRRRRVRIFFKKMMFHHPGMVVAEPVGGLQLRQRVLIKLEFVACLPRARQLQLVKDAEFHGPLFPRSGCLFVSLYSQAGPSPA